MERSTLPRTLGIFALVWAILSVVSGLQGCCGLVAMEAMGPIMKIPMQQLAKQQKAKERELEQIDSDIAILKAGGNPLDQDQTPPVEAPVEEGNGADNATPGEAGADGGEQADAAETGTSVFETYDRTSLASARARRKIVKNNIKRQAGATAPMDLFKNKELRNINRMSAGFTMFNGFVFGLLLLVGAIGLMTYKPWSFALSSVALAGKILLNVAELAVTILVIMPRMEPLMEEINNINSQGPMAGFNQGIMAFSGVITYVTSGIAIFVPLLILFLVRKKECREALLGGSLQRHDGTELPYREDV